MDTRQIVTFALGLGLQACGAAVTSESGPALPHVAASELQAQEVAGPSLDCAVAAGQLSCGLAIEAGFRVQVVTVLVQTETTVEEIGFFGDVDVAKLTSGAFDLATLPQYPVDLDIQVHFTTDSIGAPEGTTVTEASVRCRAQLTSDATSIVACDAGAYERWNVFFVPDAELAEAWEAERFGTASIQATVESEMQDPSVCFRDYPRCDSDSFTESWDEVPDQFGHIPEAVRYTFTMPREASTSVNVTTNVMYNPAPVDGPGIYVVTASGEVVRQ